MNPVSNKNGSDVVWLKPQATLSDTEIIEGLKRKELAAASAFYHRFGEQMNSLVWKLLGADEEHKDLVHTAMIEVLTSIHQLKDTNAFSKWVSRITVNTVFYELRKRKSRRRISLLPKPPQGAQTRMFCDNHNITFRIYAILECMKPESHIVFVLFLEGNTSSEIAALRNVSLATAKRRVKVAKREFLKRAKQDIVLAGYIEDNPI